MSELYELKGIKINSLSDYISTCRKITDNTYIDEENDCSFTICRDEKILISDIKTLETLMTKLFKEKSFLTLKLQISKFTFSVNDY